MGAAGHAHHRDGLRLRRQAGARDGPPGQADVVVADHPPVAAANGETHHALDAGVIEHDQILSLGALVAGDVAGRTAAEQITIADLCGVGVQDAAVAAEVMRRAAGAGLGRRLEL